MVIYRMLDLAQIEGFDWDEGNSRKSVEKHDFSQAEAEQIFFNDPLLIVEDVSHSVRELRLQALAARTPDDCFTSASRYAVMAG